MATTFTITGTNPIIVRNPKWGYGTDIVIALNVSKTTAGPQLFDGGAAYDYRVCTDITHLLSKTDSALLAAYMRDPVEARNGTVSLGLTGGWFPGGPDWGDTGSWTARYIKNEPSGMLLQPWKHFEHSLDLCIVTHPAYTAPAARKQGNLTIGTVTGLKYPTINPTPSHAVSHSITLGGLPYTIDGGRPADLYYTDISIDCNHGNAAALLAYLTGTARATDWTITAPDDYHLFGIDNGSSGTYTVRFADNRIRVKHYRYDMWEISFSVFRVSGPA